MTHSPTPWMRHEHVEFDDGRSYITDNNGKVVASGISGDSAIVILRAVNAHDDLVKALRDALEYVRLTRDEFEDYEKTEATIKAALAKAGVK